VGDEFIASTPNGIYIIKNKIDIPHEFKIIPKH
jgi:hypothetical protein